MNILLSRADQLILERGLAPTRSASQRLIERQAVQWSSPTSPIKGWHKVRKAGETLPIDAEFQVLDDAETRWVSRAGLKLEGALQHCAGSKPALPLKGKVCLDVGQSTGGFTEVLLDQGAKRVVGVDVGHGQVHPKIRDDERVSVIEGVNARHMTADELGEAMPRVRTGKDGKRSGGFMLIVGDLSFISLTLVLPALVPLLADKGELLMLVKPQFELQPGQIGKGGLVKDPASYAEVEARIRQACAEQGLAVADYFESAIAGGDGNREFFVRARRADM
jgi:23S rRNA (cytidine1920-2'-O)/16S rRNA (cytidine1409-2'-O)-methyltransferase